MVREAERRKRKYEKNVDGDQVGRAFKAQKDIMVDQEKTYFPQITLIEMKTKKLCEAQGIATYLIPQYINYARECYSKAKRFSQDTLKNELQYLANKWTSRGLLGSKLQEIAKIFGVDITAPPPPALVGKCLLGMYRYSLSQNTTRYMAFGTHDVYPLETFAQDALPKGTFKKLTVRVEANSLSVDAIITVRVNGVNSALILTIPAGTVDIYEIETDVAINKHDLCNFMASAPSGTGSMVFHPNTVFEID